MQAVNKTGYFTHKDCWKHEMGQGHPECPQRLDAIEDRLLISGVADALDRREAEIAPLSDIELAHGRMFVAGLRGLSDVLKAQALLNGRNYVAPDDVQAILPQTVAHRMVPVGDAGRGSVEQVRAMLDAVPLP